MADGAASAFASSISSGVAAAASSAITAKAAARSPGVGDAQVAWMMTTSRGTACNNAIVKPLCGEAGAGDWMGGRGAGGRRGEDEGGR